MFLNNLWNMHRLLVLFFLIGTWMPALDTYACSVLYYVDPATGKIYVANNEDYWYDVEACIEIRPSSGKKLARLWYGWDNFAQGGINEAGLFFDGAVTPEQQVPGDGHGPKGNLGDELLARCRTVDEALLLLEEKGIALSSAHMMLGDAKGKAVVVEWLDGKRRIIPMNNNRLVMTNFLLEDPARGNYPCPRYQAIQNYLDAMEDSVQPVDLRVVGNAVASAVQLPREAEGGRVGGTLYSSFMNISDMEFVLIYQLDSQRITRLNLNEAFGEGKRKKIKLK